MKLNMYVIYDKVAKTQASQIMLSPSDELITRHVKTAKLGDIVESNLGDFDLKQVGSFDTDSLAVDGFKEPVLVAHLDGIK